MVSQPTPNSLLKAIQAGLSRVEADKVPDTKDITEITQLQIAKAKLENKNEETLISLRKTYGINMIVFLWVYFLAAILLIGLSSIGLIKLTDTVSASLIGGTAVSVLGVVGTIIAGLFRVKGD